MKRVLVTGASGFIGSHLCRYLAENNFIVIALVRFISTNIELQHPNILQEKGDILDYSSLLRASKDCHSIFHLAAFANMWHRDPAMFFNINYIGTKNILEAAVNNKVERFINVSTSGVLGPSNGIPTTEQAIRSVPFFNKYELTKSDAEKLSFSYIQKGLTVICVNPTRVFGPGNLSVSNGVTRMIYLYHRGLFRTIPGHQERIGNYAFISDVVFGIYAAFLKGKSGECYILGGENINYQHFFETVSSITGVKRSMITLRSGVLVTTAKLIHTFAKVTNTPPFITAEWAVKFSYDWAFSSQKAIDQLDYKITPFREALILTVNFLKEKHKMT